jgi:hypothetical protein
MLYTIFGLSDKDQLPVTEECPLLSPAFSLPKMLECRKGEMDYPFIIEES